MQWLGAWLGGVLLGIANGSLREALLARRLSEQRANQLSVLTGIAALAGYFSALERLWPLRSTPEALEIGGSWAAMTVLFEFGFGRLVARQSWSELLGSYNVFKGRLWPLMLLWIGLGPELIRRFMSPRGAADAGA